MLSVSFSASMIVFTVVHHLGHMQMHCNNCLSIRPSERSTTGKTEKTVGRCTVSSFWIQ